MVSCFVDNTELGTSRIAERTNLSKSTTYELVNALAVFECLEQIEDKKYRLGLELFKLGNLVQSHMDVCMGVRPYCQLLADKYRTTVHLATHSEGEIIYIDEVDSDSSVVICSQTGKRVPMYYVGVGRVTLAFLPGEYMEEYILSRPLMKMVEHTITTRDGLLKESEQVRERSYAVDDKEIEPGLHRTVTPIFNHKRQSQMAVSMPFPHGRMWDLDREQTVWDVLYYTKQASGRLRYIE